tara:strand:- start:21194 stop:22174 length:981 start_codon:yes stop_codon:yes gene_type:complete
MKLRLFIEAIRNESLGLSLGDPWRYGENSITCVVPILNSAKEAPSYLTFPQAKNLEVKDTGKIDLISLYNKEDKPVFIRIGDVVKGGSQERSFTMSRLIMAKEKVKVPVVCVHASKGIFEGTKFGYGGISPMRDSYYNDSNLRGVRVNQGESWSHDTKYASNAVGCMMAHSGGTQGSSNQVGSIVDEVQSFRADDMVNIRDTVNKNLDEVLKKVPLFDNQVGLILIDEKGFYNLDCFDLHIPFKSIKEALIGKESISISSKAEDSVFEYKPKNVKSSIKKVLERGFEEKEVFGKEETSTVVLDYKDYTGEAVLFKDELIHLMIARK